MFSLFELYLPKKLKIETIVLFSRDGNGIPKSEGIGDAWDIVDSATGFVRNGNLVAPK